MTRGNSDYNEPQARRVIVSGLKGYETARKRAEKSGIARKVEEEMKWKVELDNVETCQLLIKTENFEKGIRKEKASRMQYAFQQISWMEVVEVAGYEHDVARSQSQDKKKAAELWIEI